MQEVLIKATLLNSDVNGVEIKWLEGIDVKIPWSEITESRTHSSDEVDVECSLFHDFTRWDVLISLTIRQEYFDSLPQPESL